MSHPSEHRRFFFRKDERLRSKIAFEYLFEHGSSFRIGMLKFFYVLDVPPAYVKSPLSVAFAAPKRNFKHAVTRNFLKRRMREAYRLHKHSLHESLQEKDRNMAILIVYSSRHKADYATIQNIIVKALNRLSRELSSE